MLLKWRIPGLAIGVVKDGEIIYSQGFGYRDLENKLPVTTKTVFGIGSISKSFTAMWVALLVDEAKLKWDTPDIFKNGEITALAFRNKESSVPAGGVNSNLEDMLRWLKLHLNQGKVGERQLVSARSLNELLTPQMPVSYTPESAVGPLTDYRMGWNIQPYLGHHLNHVGGWIEGFVCWISFMPVDNIGVAVLGNMSDCELPFLLNYVIYSRLLGLEEIDWKRILDKSKPRYLSPSYNVRKKPRSDPDRPPRPSEELEGTYDHPGYGRIVIAQENGNLWALFNGEKMVLNHVQDNIFLTEHPLEGFNGKRIRFITDDQGKIGKLAMMVQLGVKDIVFLRQ